MLTISKRLLNDIMDHSKTEYPNEACGILAGEDGEVRRVCRMSNSDRSSKTYMMDPSEQFRVFKELRRDKLELSAIYHTHVASEAYPSETDKKLAFYPEAAYVIVSLMDRESPAVRAFRIIDGNVEKEEIEVA